MIYVARRMFKHNKKLINKGDRIEIVKPTGEERLLIRHRVLMPAEPISTKEQMKIDQQHKAQETDKTKGKGKK